MAVRRRKTKIVCTIGPASERPEVLRKMFEEGLDVVRLNFSHGTYTEHLRRLRLVRRLSKQMGARIEVLQDLAGYRIRVGRFKNGKGAPLVKRRVVTLTNQRTLGDERTIPFDYPGDLRAMRAGTHIFLDDGNLELVARYATAETVRAEVITGGFLKERKGVNIPALRLAFADLTAKDDADIAFGVENGVDIIAQSFVRDERDIAAVRRRLRGLKARVIAKIENHEGICNIDAIIGAADGIMVARGDLGVSLPIYEIPMIQKMIIARSNHKKKFVITATQMLETMIENPRPTRAEVSDVANAILDGSDYVMLSGETAIGSHPVGAVRMMREIIDFTEKGTLDDALRYCRYYGKHS